MSVYSYPLPTSLNGEALESELAAAGIEGSASVVDDTLDIATDAPKRTVDPVVAAHTGQPTAEQQAEIERQSELDAMGDRARQVLTKARAVLAGEDTFTVDQIQRLVAALVIREARGEQTSTSSQPTDLNRGDGPANRPQR